MKMLESKGEIQFDTLSESRLHSFKAKDMNYTQTRNSGLT